jgi:hypothetical protein
MPRRFSALVQSLLSFLLVEALTYRPEKHYMRGPRQK